MTETPEKNESLQINGKLKYLIGAITLIAVPAILALLVILNPERRMHTPPYVYDTRVFRAISHSLSEFTYDHDGEFPNHSSELIATYPEDWTQDAFISPYDRDQSVSFAINKPSPGQWYQYGSYWFYHISDLSRVEDPSNLILMYREPKKEHDQYIVGFLDGIALQMSVQEFRREIENQQEISISSE